MSAFDNAVEAMTKYRNVQAIFIKRQLEPTIKARCFEATNGVIFWIPKALIKEYNYQYLIVPQDFEVVDIRNQTKFDEIAEND